MFETMLSYSISEDAQRAEIQRTGQPVLRNQTVTGTVPLADLDLFSLDANGKLVEHIVRYECLAEVWPGGVAPAVQTFDSLLAAIRKGSNLLKAKLQAKRAVEDHMREVAAAFIADPSARPDKQDRPPVYWAEIDGVHFDSSSQWTQLRSEVERRLFADQAMKDDQVRIQKERDEQVVRDFVAAWIAREGTDTERLQFAENLLCCEAIHNRIADSVFDKIDHPKYVKLTKSAVSCTDPDDCCETVKFENHLANCLRPEATWRFSACVRLCRKRPQWNLSSTGDITPSATVKIKRYSATVKIMFPFGEYTEDYAL